MGMFWNNNANLTKLFVSGILFFVAIQTSKAQESDPITDAVNREKNQEEGLFLHSSEMRKLERIHKKYEITEKEIELRIKQESGQKINLFGKYRIGKSNRKDYLRAKKLEKFNKEVIFNRQNEATKKRMAENEKKIKARDKQIKKKQRRKNFINLFR